MRNFIVTNWKHLRVHSHKALVTLYEWNLWKTAKPFLSVNTDAATNAWWIILLSVHLA